MSPYTSRHVISHHYFPLRYVYFSILLSSVYWEISVTHLRYYGNARSNKGNPWHLPLLFLSAQPDTKAALATVISYDPQSSNEDCVNNLRGDLPLEVLYSSELLKGPTALFRVLRDYLTGKGLQYTLTLEVTALQMAWSTCSSSMCPTALLPTQICLHVIPLRHQLQSAIRTSPASRSLISS